MPASDDPPRVCAPAYPRARSVALAGVLAALAVLACVAGIDRPLAWAVYERGLPAHRGFAWLTHIPEVLVALAVLLLLLTPARLAWRRPLAHAERVLLAMSVSLAIAVSVKDVLKVVFGRAWPMTWTGHNLSLIHDHFYGFLWLQFHRGYQSFPSGHTTMAFATMGVLWLAAPRLRWLAALVCALTIAGLAGMDYHFAGDMVGGAFIGSVSALYVWRCAQRLAACSSQQPAPAQVDEHARADGRQQAARAQRHCRGGQHAGQPGVAPAQVPVGAVGQQHQRHGDRGQHGHRYVPEGTAHAGCEANPLAEREQAETHAEGDGRHAADGQDQREDVHARLPSWPEHSSASTPATTPPSAASIRPSL